MLEVRPTRPDDLEGLGALFADRFGHSMTPEEWAWKYRQIPGEGRSLVAVDHGFLGSDTVLAHAGALALPARWPAGEGRIWQLVDFAGTTRRRGLRAALVDLGRTLLADLPGAADAPWIFGFPSERHFRLGERVFGYRPLTAVEPLAGPLPDAAGPAARIESGDFGGDWAEAVWEACGGLGVRRSAAFLNWRYYARPGRYYRFYRMFSEGREAFAVFAFVADGAWAAEVWLPPAGRWYPSLLAVAADLRASGLSAWHFWPRSPPGGDLGLDLRAALGLRPAGEHRFVGCRGRSDPARPDPARPDPAGSDPVAAAAGFPYSMGDYDLV